MQDFRVGWWSGAFLYINSIATTRVYFIKISFYIYLIDFKLNVQFDSRMLDASALVQKLQENSDNNVLRCPYYANIEIERRKLLHGRGDDYKLMEALMQYFERYCIDFSSSLWLFELKFHLKLLTYSLLSTVSHGVAFYGC